MKDLNEKDFGEFLVKEKKILSEDDLTKCLEIQKAMNKWGIEKSIDKVIVEKGFLDAPRMGIVMREFLGGDEEFLPGYRIIKKLGEGAMGEVYQAVDLGNKNRSVAVKVLFSHLGKRKATAQRFIQEAELCIKKLNHPNIVKGFEVGYEGNHDCFFYVMELVEGSNLRKIFQETGPFPEKLAVKVMMQMASALEHAFEFRLVHRDIKPDNIMLTKDEEAKLCDLGLARDWAKDLSLTRTGAVMGTPFYISPEAAAGTSKLDCRSDIYSLGATMYHMAVGKVPFSGGNAHVVLAKHLTAPLIPPRELRPDLSVGFSGILQMMMEKAQEDRYQTPVELLEDLKKLQAGYPPKAMIKYQTTSEIYQNGGEKFHGPVSELLQVIEEMEPGEELGFSRELVKVEEERVPSKRQDSVEEYLLTRRSQISPQEEQGALWTNFFNSSERRALSKAQTAQWKLLVLGAVLGGVAIVATVLLCYVLVKLLGRIL